MIIVKIEGTDVNTGIDFDRISSNTAKIKRTNKKKRSMSVDLFYQASETLPAEGQDIQILDDTTVLFGGIISDVSYSPISPATGTSAPIVVSLSSNGYNYIPTRRTLSTTTFEDTDAGSVVTNLITNYLVDEGITAGTISTGATVTYYYADVKSIKEILDDMADASGYTWDINDSKELDFVAASTPTTSTDTIEEGDRDHFKLSPSRTLNNFRNKQFVIGGLDNDGTQIIAVAEDSASISARATAEGNSGVYGNVYKDDNIQTAADATATATELLNRYKNPANIKFSSYDRFELGKIINVTYPKYDISTNTPYLITSESISRKNHLFIYTYTAEYRDTSDFSDKSKDNAVDFFSKLAKKSNMAISASGGSSLNYQTVADEATALTVTTTTQTRTLSLTLPVTSDIIQWLTVQWTAANSGALHIDVKLGTTLLKSFTMAYVTGEDTRTIHLPKLSQTAGLKEFNVDLYVDSGTLTIDDYAHTGRWEKVSNLSPDINPVYKITIDHTKVDTDLTNYPVLIKFEEWSIIPSKPAATRYYFTDASNNEIPFDIEYYGPISDPGGSTENYADFHVKVPFISSTVDTVIYLKTDSVTDRQNAAGVWDSNFKAVYHMSYSDKDRTSNNNDFISNNANDVQGENGFSQSFNGTNQKIELPNTTDFDVQENFTITLIIKIDDDTQTNTYAFDNTNLPSIIYGYTSQQLELFAAFYTGTNPRTNSGITLLDTEGFAQIEYKANGSYLKKCKNGTITTDSITFTIGSRLSDYSIIGASSTGNYCNCTIDEVRISNIARSDAWTKADYYNLINHTLISAVEKI